MAKLGALFERQIMSADKKKIVVSVTTIEQRIRQPERQPTAIKDVMPIHKFLSVRRSQRCRHCEHNLSKPEYNPSSVKFKLHLGAL